MLASELIEEMIWAVEKVGNVGVLIQPGETLSIKVVPEERSDMIIITTKTEEELKSSEEYKRQGESYMELAREVRSDIVK